ncbi:MAG: hypothetical protein ACFFCQ_17730 [Promethearchaeota archaeon]
MTFSFLTADGIARVWLYPVRWRMIGQPATRMTPDEKEDSRKKTEQCT